MNPFLAERTADFEKIIEHGKGELSGLRTGRAHSSMVTDVLVMAYGVSQPVKALAAITVPDPRTITVEPWDKSILGDVERGLRDAGLGFNPASDGKVIRIPLPQMTEESRREVLKVLGQKLEQCRISVRQVRDKIREEVQEQEKEKKMSEDEKYALQEQLDETVKEYNERIKTMGDEKEKEIMTV